MITEEQEKIITDATTETSVATSTIKYTTTTTDTTSSSTSTTSTTTTTATTTVATEYTEKETVSVEEESIEEYIPTEETYTETVDIPIIEETKSDMTINYSINELTYYSGPSGCCGRWGRTLLNDYSIASNLLPDGTIVHIESDDGSINGDYRVDDTGGMADNVIDIFYIDYSNVPYPFSRDGRISCTVWVYE